jgi:hypothetical protein
MIPLTVHILWLGVFTFFLALFESIINTLYPLFVQYIVSGLTPLEIKACAWHVLILGIVGLILVGLFLVSDKIRKDLFQTLLPYLGPSSCPQATPMYYVQTPKRGNDQVF